MTTNVFQNLNLPKLERRLPQSIAQRQRLESEAFDRCLRIDESNLDSKIYTELKPVKITSVKIKWNEENGHLTVPSRKKKQKNLIKELSWMNSVRTGKHVLKEYPVLVCFGLKCLHSKHPGVQTSRLKYPESL